MAADGDVAPPRPVAPAEAEQVDDDEPAAVREQGYHLRPEVRGGREAVQEDDRLPGAPRPRRVAVQPRPIEVDELAAHWPKMAPGATERNRVLPHGRRRDFVAAS